MATLPADERAIMRGWIEGSPVVLSALYDRLAPILFPLALRIVRSRERACCVVEDAFEEMWRDRARWRNEQTIPIPALIARCRELALAQAAHEALNRASGTRAQAPVPTVANEGAVPNASSPREIALEALAALPELDRRALEEAYFHGTNARDVAVMLGAPTSDAEAMLRRALVRFRGHVDQADGVATNSGSEEPAA